MDPTAIIAIIIIAAIVIFIVNKIKDGAKYKRIREENDKPPIPVPIQKTETKKDTCTICGAKLTPGAPFCEACGHSVTDE